MAASYNELHNLGSHATSSPFDLDCLLQETGLSTTTIVDRSGNANNGTTFGLATNLENDTGPTNYLTSALDFSHRDAGSRHGDIGELESIGDLTVTAWVKRDTSFTGIVSKWGGDIGTSSWILLTVGNKLSFKVTQNGSNRIDAITDVDVLTTGWNHVSAVWSGGSAVTIYVDGVSVANTVTAVGTPTSIYNSVHEVVIGRVAAAPRACGPMAGMAISATSLTSSEVVEEYNGPEPINSVAPVASGTASVGESLSATTGTWGLDAPFASGSNGTVTYSYQWTRSDDGTGTGEADIAGATSSTYTIQASDSGKYLRCRVRASNDGGFDAAADTNSNFTAQVASGFNAAWARRNTQLIGGGCL